MLYPCERKEKHETYTFPIVLLLWESQLMDCVLRTTGTADGFRRRDHRRRRRDHRLKGTLHCNHCLVAINLSAFLAEALLQQSPNNEILGLLAKMKKDGLFSSTHSRRNCTYHHCERGYQLFVYLHSADTPKFIRICIDFSMNVQEQKTPV